jgi:hypothetical protein
MSRHHDRPARSVTRSSCQDRPRAFRRDGPLAASVVATRRHAHHNFQSSIATTIRPRSASGTSNSAAAFSIAVASSLAWTWPMYRAGVPLMRLARQRCSKPRGVDFMALATYAPQVPLAPAARSTTPRHQSRAAVPCGPLRALRAALSARGAPPPTAVRTLRQGQKQRKLC